MIGRNLFAGDIVQRGRRLEHRRVSLDEIAPSELLLVSKEEYLSQCLGSFQSEQDCICQVVDVKGVANATAAIDELTLCLLKFGDEPHRPPRVRSVHNGRAKNHHRQAALSEFQNQAFSTQLGVAVYIPGESWSSVFFLTAWPRLQSVDSRGADMDEALD